MANPLIAPTSASGLNGTTPLKKPFSETIKEVNDQNFSAISSKDNKMLKYFLKTAPEASIDYTDNSTRAALIKIDSNYSKALGNLHATNASSEKLAEAKRNYDKEKKELIPKLKDNAVDYARSITSSSGLNIKKGEKLSLHNALLLADPALSRQYTDVYANTSLSKEDRNVQLKDILSQIQAKYDEITKRSDTNGDGILTSKELGLRMLSSLDPDLTGKFKLEDFKKL